MPHRSLRLLVFVALFFTGPAVRAEDFFRSELQNLSIPDNWRSVDMPGKLEVWSMDAGPHGEIWVGSVASAARYNGTAWEDFPLPEGMDSGPVKAIHRSVRGVVYALTPVGFFSLEKGKWRQLGDVMSRRYPTGVIYEARNGDIWIGHDSGLSVLRADGRFRTISTGRYVVSFCEDQEGFLWWVEGEYRKVYRARPETDVIENAATWQTMLAPFAEPVRFASLEATPDDRIWLGDIKRNDRLRYYDLKKKTWFDQDMSAVVGASGVFDLAQDARGRLWVCSGGALVMIEGETMQAFAPAGMPMMQTWTQLIFAEDNSLWLSQVRGRPIRLDLGGGPWRMQTGYHYQCDAFGSRWFLAEDGEIVSAALNSPGAEPVRHQARGAIEHPVGLFASRNGEVWALGTHQGVAAFSIYDGTAWQRQSFPEFATGFDFDTYCERADGTAVLGSGQFWDAPPAKPGGVLAVHRAGREWAARIWPNSPDGFPDRVHEVVETPAGDLFAGGSRFIRMRGDTPNNENRALEAPGTWISSLKVAPDGTLWGSSYGKGVFRSRTTGYEWFGAFERGLDDATIIDLAVLKGGDVVALTNRSIYRFDGDHWTETLRLPLARPLPEGGGSLKVAPDGALWINLAHPDWYFRWSQRSGYHSAQEPAFATLRYEFDTVPPTTTLAMTAAGEPDAHSFTGVMQGWDAGSRTPRRALQYSYRMNGGTWSPFSDSATLTLHQLPEGRHRIEARARDLDFNVDPIGAAAVVEVAIPFWKENWFYPMLAVFAFAGVLVYVLNFRHRARHVLELEHQKLNFFTNLSHEIRTPLALVMAPLERVLKLNPSADMADYLKQAHRSSEELKRIVDQLLDFRRAQSGVMQSSPENTDLVVFTSDLVKSFTVMAAERRQTVTFTSTPARLPCRVDVIKLQSILNNLVLNGLRYSPAGAAVRVGLRVESGPPSVVILTVEDQGIGMDTEMLNVALKPFTRGRDERVRAIKGTGIGLAYVNELLQICGGTLGIESPLDPANHEHPGTRVTVRLPVELLPSPAPAPVTTPPPADHDSETDPTETTHQEPPLLLILEDDRELGDFLGRELRTHYRVLWETDGETGLQRARETIPDLVLTDRMMPKLDGFEVSRALRADLATAHIPIIMLTAASSRVNELEALRSGVNEFLGKPFSIEALEHRLKNQLAIRDGLRAKLKRDLELAHDAAEAAKIEDPFLKKAHEITEAHLGDYLFDTDGLATKLGMSRSSLYRKLQATVDLSPPAFIREQRIRRSAQLLLGTTLGVAEVMEAVGILEQRTFNKWFRTTFGCTPTDYRAQHGGKSGKATNATS